jgi:hypothetical protein
MIISLRLFTGLSGRRIPTFQFCIPPLNDHASTRPLIKSDEIAIGIL